MNTQQTSTFVGEKLSLEASPTQKVRTKEWTIYSGPSWSGHLFAHWLVPRSSISSLRKSKQTSAVLMPVQEQSDTTIERRSGATLVDVANAGPPIQTRICVRNLLQRRHGRFTEIHDRRHGVLHFRPLREGTFMHRPPEELDCKTDCDPAMLSFQKRCSLSAIFV